MSGVPPEALLFWLLQKNWRKKASNIKPMDNVHCLHSPKAEHCFLKSITIISSLISLFSGGDKQDFLQSGMTQQHWGPQWFFALLSKQNYYSLGSRAAMSWVLHHLTPLWNISHGNDSAFPLQPAPGWTQPAAQQTALCSGMSSFAGPSPPLELGFYPHRGQKTVSLGFTAGQDEKRC